ncbi:MAG: hypothetical protein JWO80_1408 [Bryobacterales bacterium]|nr:hypothetical protein [Bryobacterales bacterium]
MKKSRFNEEQTIGILKQHKAGQKMSDLAREHGSAKRRCPPGRVSTAGWM